MTDEGVLFSENLHLFEIALGLHAILLLCQIRKIVINSESPLSNKISLSLIWGLLFLNPIILSQIIEQPQTVIQMEILFYYLFFQLDYKSYEGQNSLMGIGLELSIIVIGKHFGVLVLACNCFIMAELFRKTSRSSS